MNGYSNWTTWHASMDFAGRKPEDDKFKVLEEWVRQAVELAESEKMERTNAEKFIHTYISWNITDWFFDEVLRWNSLTVLQRTYMNYDCDCDELATVFLGDSPAYKEWLEQQQIAA